MAQIAPYGTWKSPITAQMIASKSVRLSEPQWLGDDIYWLESRPSEGGRSVIVRRTSDGITQDITPAGFNVRTGVHEYGGGAWTVLPSGWICFSNHLDGQIYLQDPVGNLQRITSGEGFRYADLDYFGVDCEDFIICVREDHSVKGQEPENMLVRISLISGEVVVLRSGADFYSSPRFCTRGQIPESYLAWVEWDHPNMPWDGTRLMTGLLSADGSRIEYSQRIVGSEDVSVLEPMWRDDKLYYISDATGWWNLYNTDANKPICAMDAEFTLPPWLFGYRHYDFVDDGTIVCTYTQNGIWHLGLVNTHDGSLKEIDTGYTDFSYIHANGSRVVCVAGSFSEPDAIVVIDVTTGEVEIIKCSSDITLDPGCVSVPRQIEFRKAADGSTAYGLDYPPANKDFVAPEGELPPLLVMSHGGPTAAAVTSLQLYVQYYTSRGFRVLNVNYGGSTGYGREYRDRLNGQWGIVDVEDCINGAKHLADKGMVDRDRMVIRGGSASGFTTLCALTFHDVFKAGASHYGISDAEALVRDTHKFESQYPLKLIAPYPADKDVYYRRSPINFTHLLGVPMILFQGSDDKAVPPNQAEMMVDALRKKGLPVAYVAFEGEGHGFRQEKNIIRAIEGEISFFAQVLGFELADPTEPILIENLK